MDWNVFFSTMSQTCGAVVGIFSAFLITKIIADQSEFSRLRDKISTMISKSEYLKAHFDRVDFEQLNNKELKDLSDILYNSIKDEELDKSPEFYYELIDQPLYASKSDAIEYIKYAIQRAEKYQLEKKKKQEEEDWKKSHRESLERAFGSSVLANIDLMNSIKPITNPYASSPLDRIKESMAHDPINNNREQSSRKQLIIDSKHQVSINRKVLNELEGSNTAHQLISRSLVIVLLLFFIGVIYPLSFLPLVPGAEITLSIRAFFDILFSLKGALLGLLAVSFSFLIATFWSVNNRLKLSPKECEDLKKMCQPEGFSIFLKNYYDNN